MKVVSHYDRCYDDGYVMGLGYVDSQIVVTGVGEGEEKSARMGNKQY